MTDNVSPKNREQAAEELKHSMEMLAEQLRKLILEMPATSLIGLLWTSFTVQNSIKKEGNNGEFSIDLNIDFGLFVFIMEYIHAVLACSPPTDDPVSDIDQKKIETLLSISNRLRESTQLYCMASTEPGGPGSFGAKTGEFEFFAKTSWVGIRGNRHQTMEEEFFRFILAPHDDILRQVYRVGSLDIAVGIQSIANSMRTGLGNALQIIREQMSEVHQISDAPNSSFEDAIKHYMESYPDRKVEAKQAFQDLFFGGICNLSTHTQLPQELLADLAFSRGGNSEFYAPGEFRGTPMRTMPARIRPLVKLDDGYYAADPSFVRDSSYRAIQRALIARMPNYRENWNARQKYLTEHAFEQMFPSQLAGAIIFHEVYYKNPLNGQWIENDVLILLDDILIQIEIKAGLTAMHSPATDFERHVRVVKELVIKAYNQTRRFFEYANSAQVIPLFELKDGTYNEIGQLSLSNYRTIIPIGLTVESFTPFSSMCKELPELEPILGLHPFVSMSIDDLFVLTKFLPTSGELLHYLEVRQQVAGLRGALIFDETEHLGAYIAKNRFDMDIRNQLAEGVNMAVWSDFSQIIDEYFAREEWHLQRPPSQEFPYEIKMLFKALDTARQPGWLKAQSIIRNLSTESREHFAESLGQTTKTLPRRLHRWFVYSFPDHLMIWLQSVDYDGPSEVMVERAEALTLAVAQSHLDVLSVTVNRELAYETAALIRVSAPSRESHRYPEAQKEAERMRQALDQD